MPTSCWPRLERRGQRAPGPLGEAALVLLAAGDGDRARVAAVEELERALRWGAVSAIGTARRVLGELPPTLALLERAVDDIADTPCRLELAQALLALGARPAAGESARPRRVTVSARALDLAVRCDARRSPRTPAGNCSRAVRGRGRSCSPAPHPHGE